MEQNVGQSACVETCELNAVEPQGHHADVLNRLVNHHPNSRIDDLLPWAYPAERAKLAS